MLTMINGTKWETPEEIETRYPHCKYLLTDFTDLNNLRGHLYAVSEDQDSFLPLCELSDRLMDEGIVCCIMGEYKEGMIGVLRELAG